MDDMTASTVDLAGLLQGSAPEAGPEAPAPPTGAELKELVDRDLSDRSDWAAKQLEWQRLRLAEEKPRRQPYPNAPDAVEPLIDDNVTQIAAAEASMLWSARVVASFLPLDAEAMGYKAQAEAAFDTLLRLTLNARAKTTEALDLKGERGMSVAKLVENRKAADGMTLPDFEPVDPLDVVAPTATRRLADADRVTHIVRYTEREFLAEGRARGWGHAQTVAQAVRSTRGGGGGGQTGQAGTARSRIGATDAPSGTDEVEVWEVYHWREVQGADGQSAQRRWCTVFAKDAPNTVLAEYGWKWPDTVESMQELDPVTGQPAYATTTTEGTDRRWPFVQFRRESRSSGYYDTRGAAQILKSDQKEATAHRNGKMVLLDFACLPMFKGGGANAQTLRLKPGSVLPAGVEPVVFPFPTQVLDYNTDLARAAAARRVGAPQGALSSVDRSRDSKTATEVSQSALNANLLASDAVERFAEPLGELFTMMWEWLQHHPAPLPAVSGDAVSVVGEEVFRQRFLVVAGVSGRSGNPDLVLRQLQGAAEMQKAFPGIAQYVRGDALARLVFDLIDPKLTPRLVVDPQAQGPGGTAPIEQQVAAMGQYLQAMAQDDAMGGGAPAGPAAPGAQGPGAGPAPEIGVAGEGGLPVAPGPQPGRRVVPPGMMMGG